MGLYDVLSVSPAGAAEALRFFEVEAPEAGTAGDSYVLPIAGRLAGRESQVVAVEVVYHDRVLRTVPVHGERFGSLVGLVGLKLDSEFTLRAVLETDVRVDFTSISIRRQPLRTGFEPAIRPLIVTSLERSGTTWLMKMLMSHPQIVVFRHFPYESSPAKYWLHMLNVLSEPANLSDSAHPDTFHGDPHWVGHNPFYDESVLSRPELHGWIGREYVERLARFCQESIEEWYTRVARVQAQESPAYFAEKMWPTYLPVLTWELYPNAREILLVRDFRDVASSMQAFDAGRTYSRFDWSDDRSGHPDLPGNLQAGAFAVRNSWRTRGDRAHLVRYEDLVLQPADTLAALLSYLELESSPQLIERLLSQGAEDGLELAGSTSDPSLVERHRTIAEPRETIGRWRSDGGESREDFYWDAIGEVLEEFGYTKSGTLEYGTRPAPRDYNR